MLHNDATSVHNSPLIFWDRKSSPVQNRSPTGFRTCLKTWQRLMSGWVLMKHLLMAAPRWYHPLLILSMSHQIVVHEMSPTSGRSAFINRTTVVPLWHLSPTLPKEVGDGRQVLASKGDRRQIKASCGMTDLPLTVSCAWAVGDQFTIDGELLANNSLTGRWSCDDRRCYI